MIRLLFLLLGFLSITAYANNEHLKSQVSAKLVTLDKSGKTILKDVEEVSSGDIVEYKLSYENISNDRLNNLKVVGPIPVGTVYIENSASKDISKVLEVSLYDGKNWTSIPAYKEVKNTTSGKTEKKRVSVEEYRQLRWVIDRPFNAGEKLDFTFRVKVQ